MFKFLHAADLHLDSKLLGLDRYEGAPVAECRGATRRALENLVELAVKERVAFVLIAGDLYDGDWRDFNTGLFFGKQMDRLHDEQIPVIMIRGNHDAANAMTKSLPKKQNVTVLSSEQAQMHPLDDIGVALHGQSFATKAVTENLVLGYPRAEQGLFNIGLLHTGVEGRDGHERYAPCTLDDMRRMEYDYWALGHIHKRETLYRADTVIAFPGNVQGRSVRETGPKGCLLVTVDDAHKVTEEFRSLDVLRWGICHVDAAGASDLDELLHRFSEQITTSYFERDDRLLALRVEVKGACRAHADVASNPERFIAAIRHAATDTAAGQVWVEKIMDKTSPLVGPRSGQADGPLAELADLLKELSQDDTLLGKLGASELGGIKTKLDTTLFDDLDKPNRLRELLGQVGPMLMAELNGRTNAGGDPRNS
jgi:DNA repair exonuclease SbcCD nuclease subunit